MESDILRAERVNLALKYLCEKKKQLSGFQADSARREYWQK